MFRYKILFFLNDVLYQLLITKILLQKTLGSTRFLRISGMLIVLGIDYEGDRGPFTLKEKMTSEEQVGRESGRILYGFQRIVPAGEKAISCHIVSPPNIRESEVDDARGRGSFKDLEDSRVIYF